MPRAGPPVPTRGPLPSSAAGFVAGATGGNTVGTLLGATSLVGGADVAGLLSPPLRPITGAPVAFGSTRNPIRSAGTGTDFRGPKTSRKSLGVMTYRSRSATSTTCKPRDTSRYAGGRRRRVAGASGAERLLQSVFKRRPCPSCANAQPRENAPRAHCRFANAIGRGDERDTKVSLAANAEIRAGHHHHSFLLDQKLCELRARDVLRQRNPEVHGGLWSRAGKAAFSECSDRRVASLLENCDVSGEEPGRAVEGTRCGCLNSHEVAGVHERFHLRQRSNELRAAGRPAAPPSGHVVALRDRMKFDGDLASSVDVENAGRNVPVERNLRIRIVVHQQDVEFPAEPHDALEIIQWRNSGRRVVGIVQVENSSFLQHVPWNRVDVDEEIVLAAKRAHVRYAIREKRSAEIREVARLRDDCDVAAVHVGEREMRNPFFRP